MRSTGSPTPQNLYNDLYFNIKNIKKKNIIIKNTFHDITLLYYISLLYIVNIFSRTVILYSYTMQPLLS